MTLYIRVLFVLLHIVLINQTVFEFVMLCIYFWFDFKLMFYWKIFFSISLKESSLHNYSVLWIYLSIVKFLANSKSYFFICLDEQDAYNIRTFIE